MPGKSSSWNPVLSPDTSLLTCFEKLRDLATVNNGAPFDSSASLEAWEQKSSKSSASHHYWSDESQ